jgi:hypothetical protein
MKCEPVLLMTKEMKGREKVQGDGWNLAAETIDEDGEFEPELGRFKLNSEVKKPQETLETN